MWLYWVLHPVLIFALTAILLPLLVGNQFTIGWFAVAMLGFMIPTWISYHLPNGKQNQLFRTQIIGLIGFSFCSFIAYYWGAPDLFIICVVSGLVESVILLIVGQFSEISLHHAVLSGCAFVSGLTSLETGLVLVPLTLLSAWAVHLHYGNSQSALTTWASVGTSVVSVFLILG